MSDESPGAAQGAADVAVPPEEKHSEPATPAARAILVRFRVPGDTALYEPTASGPRCPCPRGRPLKVVVEAEHGLAIGTMLGEVPRPDGEPPRHRILRVASDQDLRVMEHNRVREREAFRFCVERIRGHKLPMKVVGVEFAHSGTRATFYFTSEERVDFRALVRDLAQRFHTRIEMRQIGVRDSARHACGVGICGRELCCGTFLEQFQPISIRMAKDQNLALNQQKLSGVCGRLRCCLAYEEETYHALRQGLPKLGKRVITPNGEGRVKDVDVLKRRVRVQLADGGYAEFGADEVTRPVDLGARPAKPQIEQGPHEAAPRGEPGAEAQAGEGAPRRKRRRRRRRKTKPTDGTPPPPSA